MNPFDAIQIKTSYICTYLSNKKYDKKVPKKSQNSEINPPLTLSKTKKKEKKKKGKKKKKIYILLNNIYKRFVLQECVIFILVFIS